MTSRQTGKRLRAMTGGRRNRRPAVSVRQRRVKKNEPLGPGELRRLAQLVACGSIFVALVAAKLMLPARREGFNARLSAAMEKNMAGLINTSPTPRV